MEVAFLGIDLAWGDRLRSGAAVARLKDGRRVWVEGLEYLGDIEQIVDWVCDHRGGRATVVAIDAPIIATNPPGTMRGADRDCAAVFRPFHAAPLPTNRDTCPRGIELRQLLERRGFSVDPHRAAKARGDVVIEWFPHPGQVVFLDQRPIIKYKRVSAAGKREGLAALSAAMRRRLPRRRPSMPLSPVLRGLLEQPTHRLRGRALKRHEDLLDSVLCCYGAAYFWWWGPVKNQVFGDLDEGYIVSPRLPSA